MHEMCVEACLYMFRHAHLSMECALYAEGNYIYFDGDMHIFIFFYNRDIPMDTTISTQMKILCMHRYVYVSVYIRN